MVEGRWESVGAVVRYTKGMKADSTDECIPQVGSYLDDTGVVVIICSIYCG